MPPWPRQVLFVAALVTAGTISATAGELETARTHTIAVPGNALAVESEMPRGGAYARGIRADADLDFAASRRAYAQAVDEFRQTGRELWADKATRQLESSSALERVPAAMRHLGVHMRMPPGPWLLALASAYHDKLLAVRAFLGETVFPLATQAERLYRQVLAGDPDHVGARLGIAALYADLGQTASAERELVLVPEARRNDDRYLVEMARYYAARGRADDAFRALDRARRLAPGELREVRLSNGFDRLRRDPRFVSLAAPASRDATRQGGPSRPRP